MFDINKIISVLNFRERASITESRYYREKFGININPVWMTYKYPTKTGKKEIGSVAHGLIPGGIKDCVSFGYYKVLMNIWMDTVDKKFTVHYGKEFIKPDGVVECCEVMVFHITSNKISLDINADYGCWFGGFNRNEYGDYVIYDAQNSNSLELEYEIRTIPFPNWSNRFLDKDIRDLIKVLYEITSSPTVHFIPGKGVVGVYGKVNE